MPALVFFHGGGWIFNDLDTHDELCRTIADVAHCRVFSVDYRRSPEHTYPAAIDDGDAVFEWLIDHSDEFDIDPAALALGGDSAGGTIAAALVKRIRDRGVRRLAAQFLLYPVLDYWDSDNASYSERGEGFTVDRTFMKWIWDAYLPQEWAREDPYLFPIKGSMNSLPPTVLCVAEYDVLRDEGADYARLLLRAGVPVTFLSADDQMHGFAHHTALMDSAREMVESAATHLGRVIRGG
ncbi:MULTISPECIES: alpha/beta hydrolase [Nocardiaceae]|uniref:alpha/beta hydrolase n=1 Tax=Nocardiaceae TaxID=85025 RepID=UPI000A7FB92B|nr:MULTISPECIES: alpha/beta hydrolase [Rhodococcus]